MMRKWLAFYIANWYALAVSAVLLSQQHPTGYWLADLPWASWGTELALGLTDREAVSGRALWLLLGTVLVCAGVIGSLVASLAWLADHAMERESPAPTAKIQAPPAPAAALSEQAREAADLVDDPQLRSLMQRVNARLG